VKALDPSLPPYEVMPMTERLAQSLGTRKLAATVLGGFAAISILLVMLGVWGVIGYRMTQRTQEIGIRIALGARPVDIRRMVLRDGLVLAGLGSIAGVLLFLALSRALAALLYGVGARDPLTLLAVTLALAVVGLAASWIPARRAARIDPLHSMRAT
jgi:ABC-type antimicrobial peptide transport system permease subunit